MNLMKIDNKRKVDYYVDLISDDLPKLVYSGKNYDAFKLDIKQRHVVTNIGEVNFLIRDKSNNLKYIILYGFMEEPNQIFKFTYYINNKIVLPSRETVTVDNLLDPELAGYYVMDFIENYVSKNYDLI